MPHLFVFLIVSWLMLAMQWPDNFDWESTRAINKPVSTSEKTHQEKLDSDSDKQPDVSVKVASVVGDSNDDDLDRVALNKAFKFATTSSIGLVSY